MKLLPPITLGTIAIGVSITGYTLLSGEENELQPKNIPLTSTTSQIQQQSQKSMWEILDEAKKRADSSQLIIPTDREVLIDFVNKNPTLKIRIQGMGWYRDILLGKTPLDIPFNGARDMIRDAALIEDELMKNSSLIHQLQKSREWEAYLRGETPPHNIIGSCLEESNSYTLFLGFHIAKSVLRKSRKLLSTFARMLMLRKQVNYWS